MRAWLARKQPKPRAAMAPTGTAFPTRGVSSSEPRSYRGYAAQAPPVAGVTTCLHQLGTTLEPTSSCAEHQVPSIKYVKLREELSL